MITCARCGKPLQRFAVEVTTRDGPMGWGPKCASLVFRQAARKTRRTAANGRERPRTTSSDPRQTDLFA
jgi:hypothetical protein